MPVAKSPINDADLFIAVTRYAERAGHDESLDIAFRVAVERGSTRPSTTNRYDPHRSAA